MTRSALAFATFACLALAACHRGPQPPGDTGVCYHMAKLVGDTPTYNVVARGVPDMEHCAADLEGMRIRFLGLGGNVTDIVGAYQGSFLFLGSEGVFTADSFQGPRYPFLVHVGDQLVPPGSAPTQ
ncbi:MAG TPA: hypothetical protein VGL58_17290 [Caulobacteraceae bacterium]|jgi:hypothetical protein